MLQSSTRQDAPSGHVQAHGSERRKSNGKAPKRRSSALRFFASNQPTKNETSQQTQKDWEAQYLKELRANRPARPGGSRPLPMRTPATPEPYARAASSLSIRPPTSDYREHDRARIQERAATSLSHRRAQSDMQRMSFGGSVAGRPLVKTPDLNRSTRQVSGTSTSPTASEDASPIAYRESGMRWMEKQEARSLREAMEEMDLREEARVHAGAQGEASLLVSQHISKGLSSVDGPPKRNYREHLREGSHARSWSQGWTQLADEQTNLVKANTKCNENPNSRGLDLAQSVDGVSEGPPSNERGFDGDPVTSAPNTHIRWDSPEKKAYTSLAYKASSVNGSRRRSSANRRTLSGGGPFINPDDRIYEDTDEGQRIQHASQAATSRIPRPLMTAKAADGTVNARVHTRPFVPSTKIPGTTIGRTHRTEIHRNPPSQSRNPDYTRNERPDSRDARQSDLEQSGTEDTPMHDEVEFRSDDIRAATSKRLKDRSPKLPTPSFISGKPGQHIVSFDQEWKPRTERHSSVAADHGIMGEPSDHSRKPRMPVSTASAPLVPTINVSESPLGSEDNGINNASIPPISISAASENQVSTTPRRPLPEKVPANRPLPDRASTAPSFQSRGTHWSLASRRGMAQCSHCALPISGRIVSAASERFHPECFRCHHCSEALECVAFYPEPEAKRADRLGRIRARLEGANLREDKAGETAADDGDESMRFFCHLDYHELFSPRCRSCKTPIETEVIVACGGNWHAGHFFCAECGDPFDSQTPFVEKDGYAWCVGCHARQFSGKCKGCRKPVIEQGIRALGSEWHQDCFVCVQCQATFDDGTFFTRKSDQKPVCVNCEEIRLKA